jgi:hypothetical protein
MSPIVSRPLAAPSRWLQRAASPQRARALSLSLSLSLCIGALCPSASYAEPPAAYDEIPPSISLLLYSPCKALPLTQTPPALSTTPTDPVVRVAAKLSEADLNTLIDFESFAVASIGGRERIVAGTTAQVAAFDLGPNAALTPLPDLAFDLSAIAQDPSLDLMDLRAAPAPSALVFGLYLSSDDTTTVIAWDASTGRQASVTRIREPYSSLAWISSGGDALVLMRILYDDQPLVMLDHFATSSHIRLNRLLFAHDPNRDLAAPQLLFSPDHRQLWAITQPADAPADAPNVLYMCALPPS